MKKILFQKLLSDYMSFFLIALFSTSIVIWVFQAVNFLDIMIEDGRGYIIYLKYSFLNFPKILSKILPFVIFFSLFYVTIKLELKNELIIFWNFGVNKIEIVNFVIKISFVILIIQIFLTSFIVPKSQDLARSFLRDSTVNFLGNFLKPQKFNDTIEGLTIYTDKKDKSGNLYNIYLKRDISNDEFQITYAKKGIFKEINKTPFLALYDGETITKKNNQITNFTFSKSDFLLKNLKTNTTTYKKTQELSSSDLFKCLRAYFFLKIDKTSSKILNIENCSAKNINNILKELYKRFFIPLYIPILSIIPLFLIISSKENSKYNLTRLITFLIGLSVIIFSETTIRFISKILIGNLGLAIVPFILFLILYFLFLYKFKFKFKFSKLN